MTEIDPQFLDGVGAEVQRKVKNAFKLKELLDSIQPFDQSIYEDDFNPMDWSGGNFDDAYYGGVEHGRQQLADQIKELLY